MKLNELILKKRKNGEMLVWSRQIKCEPERGAVHAVGTDQRESIKMRLLVQTWPMNDRWAAISARKYVQLFKRNLFRKLLFFFVFLERNISDTCGRFSPVHFDFAVLYQQQGEIVAETNRSA